MSAPDGRNVAELLLHADLTARRLLHAVPDLDAAPLLRGWDDVVQATAKFCAALPRPTRLAEPGVAPRARPEDLAMARLCEMSAALHRSQMGKVWPPAGPADDALTEITDAITRAHDLVTRVHTERKVPTAAVLADGDAARARVMHTLYIGSHALGLALHHKVRALEANRTPGRRNPGGELVADVRQMRSRVAAFEQAAGDYVAGHYPRALNGQHTEPPDPDRLAMALARWDIEAHRALAATFHPAHLRAVLGVQKQITDIGHAVISAAADVGALDPDLVRPNLLARLDDAHAGWSRLASTWDPLVPAAQRTYTPQLAAAAREVTAAMLEVAYDKTGFAHPTTMAARTDLGRAAAAFQQSFATGNELAHTIADLSNDPALVVPAASAVNAHQRDQVQACHTEARVNPRDLALRRAVPIPPATMQNIWKGTAALLAATSRLMDASVQLNARPPHAAPSPRAPAHGGRVHQERITTPTPVPSYGCER